MGYKKKRTKNKNKLKRFLNILFWVAVIAYFFVALSFVSERRREQVCTTMNIIIRDSVSSHFVTAEAISRMVDNQTQKLAGNLFDSISAVKIERQLCAYAPIHNAEVYKTINGTVHVIITQRTPVVRIINRNGESFYLDQFGDALKQSGRYSAHVLVANGHIDKRLPAQGGFNVLKDTEQTKKNTLRELYDLAGYINNNKFWNAQIQQIYVNADGDFELIPRVGAHVIVFGRFERADEKFSKLLSLYRNGLNVKGWNEYSIINLKYHGQLVCTRRQ